MHALLVLAAELRALAADARRHMATLTKGLASARRAFTKLFAQFSGSRAAAAGAQWEQVKQDLRLQLQVCCTAQREHRPPTGAAVRWWHRRAKVVTKQQAYFAGAQHGSAHHFNSNRCRALRQDSHIAFAGVSHA